jgi:hypothetical protein
MRTSSLLTSPQVNGFGTFTHSATGCLGGSSLLLVTISTPDSTPRGFLWRGSLGPLGARDRFFLETNDISGEASHAMGVWRSSDAIGGKAWH